MSDDFQVGDVVVCVGPLEPGDDRFGIHETRLYRIRAVGTSTVERMPILNFVGLLEPAPWEGWLFHCFRKLPRADEQFTEQMRACKPVRVSEPA
jgi:hypothetical protein